MRLERSHAVVTQTINETLRQLAALEPEHLRAILPVLAEAQRETAFALRAFYSGKSLDAPFTRQLQRELFVLLDSVFDSIKQTRPAMYSSLEGSALAAKGLAVERVRTELVQFSGRFGEMLGAPLPLMRASQLVAGNKTLMKKHEKSAKRYAGAVGDDIRARLALGVVKKETLREMADRLAEGGGPKGVVRLASSTEYIPEGLFRRYRYWAQRLVRTEVVKQYNVSAQQELVELHKVEPSLMQRWDASLDTRACIECRNLHGQVVKPGNLFPGRVEHPPLHSACRCAITGWMKSWG